ncbi:prepilin-type N-terminal cleavage/methylation domain-containing protein [Prosthecobacter sp.]|uniref:pilus assembly FimT family protein n=1 Tax=Prosthecobacter sp. TaxID=1965333 RepID=UPI001D237DA4|nr:prepilin-type N-terminal cleavage/methylation domain-containing protein [Prosthecobacter sp.]MCB1276092.1 prepilin-type N-terminal cleavage/methylation domain-containing protein [Prosthecobacter sp.]
MKLKCLSTKNSHDADDPLITRHSPISSRVSASRGFTLVEIIIALTIVAVLAAATVPMLKGFREERLAREPVTALVNLAREARLRAMTEKRPYQVVFHSGGFTASRYFNPYLQLAELQEFMEAGQNHPEEQATFDKNDLDNGGSVTKTTELPLAPPAPKYDEYWSEKYEMPADMKYAIQFWYDTEPTYLEGDIVRLWVFQPSGICQPLKVHVERESATFDVEFAALTADIVKESVDLR